MPVWKNAFKTLIFSIVIILSCDSYAALSSRPKDVRLLISVTNTMAINDPNNIRQDAVKMFARLLPFNSYGGIWMFDGEAQKLIPVSRVSHGWMQDVIEASSRIHSNGQMSDIAEALEVASIGWVKYDENSSRNIIIVTDGKVSISTDEGVNAESKAHMLNTLIPKLKSLGVRVHCIALTGSADLELLKNISKQTEGYYVRIESAQDLQKTFLTILDFSVIPDGIPIEENRFLIDTDISEITLVVFTNSIDQVKRNDLIKLRAPNGVVFDIKNVAKNMKWFQEGLTHVVSIRDPMIGEWSFVGDLDLKKKATVLSEIELEITELPSNLFVGEKIYMTASLKQAGKILTNSPLLDMCMLTTEFHTENKPGQIFKLQMQQTSPESLENTGVFTGTIGPVPYQFGNNLIARTKLLAKTLEREKVQRVKLLPIPIDMTTKMYFNEQKQKILSVKIKPDAALINPETLLLSINLEDNKSKIIKYEMPKNQKDEWELLITPDPVVTEYKVNFELSAKTVLGRDVFIQNDPILLSVPQVDVPEAQVIVVQEKASEPQINFKDLEREAELNKKQEKKVYMVSGVIFFIINLVIVFAGYFLYKLYRRSKNEKGKFLSKKIQ